MSQEKVILLHSCAGPVLRGCAVQGRELSLEFDDELLGDDTIMVTGHTTNVRNCLRVCCLHSGMPYHLGVLGATLLLTIGDDGSMPRMSMCRRLDG